MAALDRSDGPAHDAAVVAAAQALAREGCTVIALAQFSMARAQALVQSALGLPVLSTPATAIRRLQSLLPCPPSDR